LPDGSFVFINRQCRNITSEEGRCGFSAERDGKSYLAPNLPFHD
jgi:hypothetical protein